MMSAVLSELTQCTHEKRNMDLLIAALEHKRLERA